MNIGYPNDPLIYNFAQSFTRTVCWFDYGAIGFPLVLLSLPLRGNWSTKKKTQELARILLLHLLPKSKFISPSFPYIVIN